MYYFVGLRKQNKTIDLENKQAIEFYLYDYDRQVVEVKSYSEIENEQILLWSTSSQRFEAVKPQRVLLLVEHDAYNYPYFNAENKCVENSGFLIVGEDMEMGVAVLTPAFELVYAPYTTLPRYLEPIIEKDKAGKVVKNRSINFVQGFKSMRDFDLAKVPLLFRESYKQQIEQMHLELNQIYRKAMLLRSENLYEALCMTLNDYVLKASPKPYCALRFPSKEKMESGELEVKCSVLSMDEPPYPRKDCVYICFPPLYMIGTEQWAENGYLKAIKFTRVTKISKGAFRGCSFLEQVEFSNACNFTIESKAFMGTALETVVLPPTLVSIAKDAFVDCPSLKYIVVQYDSTNEKRAQKIAKLLQDAYVDKTVTLEEYKEPFAAPVSKPVFAGFVADKTYMVSEIFVYEGGTLNIMPLDYIYQCDNAVVESDLTEEQKKKGLLTNLSQLIDRTGIAGVIESCPDFCTKEGYAFEYPVLCKDENNVITDNLDDRVSILEKRSDTEYIVMKGNGELDKLSLAELQAMDGVVGL